MPLFANMGTQITNKPTEGKDYTKDIQQSSTAKESAAVYNRRFLDLGALSPVSQSVTQSIADKLPPPVPKPVSRPPAPTPVSKPAPPPTPAKQEPNMMYVDLSGFGGGSHVPVGPTPSGFSGGVRFN